MFAIKFNLDNISLLVFNISADLQFLHDSISSETPEMSENCWVIWKPPKLFEHLQNYLKTFPPKIFDLKEQFPPKQYHITQGKFKF